jgi:virulence factor
MKRDKVRIAMIGVGEMAAKVHYPSLVSFDDVEIVGVGSLDPTRLHAVCDTFNIEREHRYELNSPTGYQTMIKKVAPDGVYVIGQPHLMIDIWTWCLENGLNLYIEKPMGLNLHHARMLTYIAEKKGLITQVSHQRRSSPLMRKMREECLKKGPITHAICQFYKKDIAPYTTVRDHMLDDGSHAIDTVRWMCGGEVIAIESTCRKVLTPDINWIGITMHFDNEAIGYALLSFVSGRRVFRVEMHAPGICADVEVENKAYLYVNGDYNGIQFDAKEVAGSDEFHVFAGFRAKNREFIDSLKAGKELTSSPFRDTVKTMEVIEKVLGQAAIRGV